MKRIKLFCLPYAGGSADIYRKWRQGLALEIELEPIELAGRGKRSHEALAEDLTTIVADVVQTIQERQTGRPYAIFGHSMGALIAYEAAYRIKEQGQMPPCHLFFSGKGAPTRPRTKKAIHRLPDGEFKQELRNLGGTPEDVLNNEELLNYFLPIIRADFRIVEQYQPVMERHKLQTEFTVFTGRKDDIRLDDLLEWRQLTEQGCKFYPFPGGHFFIHDVTKEVIQIINATLAPLLKQEDFEPGGVAAETLS